MAYKQYFVDKAFKLISAIFKAGHITVFILDSDVRNNETSNNVSQFNFSVKRFNKQLAIRSIKLLTKILHRTFLEDRNLVPRGLALFLRSKRESPLGPLSPLYFCSLAYELIHRRYSPIYQLGSKIKRAGYFM